jgi:para-nitrobenzyl esterase
MFRSPAPVQAGTSEISEDCLYLNVFTPSDPGPHPVFLWIYGGGNVAGSASNPLFNGDAFARNGIVCVVINYRVGALGFLELGARLGPKYQGSANNGIKDQVQGLRWVQQNIQAFGGDPARVTVGGESAGAKNVAALMATPEASGLFQNAIIESGSAQTVFSLDQADSVGRTFSTQNLLTMSVSDLLAAQQHLLATYPGNYPFRPVVDGRFLPATPLQQIAAGFSAKVPLLMGTNRDESSLFLNPARAAEPLNQKELGNTQLNELTPIESRYEAAFPDLSTADRHLRMLTAEEYWIPCIRIAEARTHQAAATFMYRFEHMPARHGAELPYVWNKVSPPTIHDAWVNFIKTEIPSAAGLPNWLPYRLPARKTMILSLQSHLESNPEAREREIWQGRL